MEMAEFIQEIELLCESARLEFFRTKKPKERELWLEVSRNIVKALELLRGGRDGSRIHDLR